MEIITDPNLLVTEVPTTFGELSHGDVFRFVSNSYEAALVEQSFYMKLVIKHQDIMYSLATNECVYSVANSTEVIPHVAKLVVLPND